MNLNLNINLNIHIYKYKYSFIYSDMFDKYILLWTVSCFSMTRLNKVLSLSCFRVLLSYRYSRRDFDFFIISRWENSPNTSSNMLFCSSHWVKFAWVNQLSSLGGLFMLIAPVPVLSFAPNWRLLVLIVGCLDYFIFCLMIWNPNIFFSIKGDLKHKSAILSSKSC